MSMKVSKFNNIRVLVHLLSWTLLAFALLGYPYTLKKEISYPAEFLIKQVIHLCIMVIAYYMNSYYFVPYFLFNKRYVWYVISIVCFVLFASFFMSFVSRLLDLHNKEPFLQIPTIWHRLYLDRFATWTTLIMLGISTSMSIMTKWNKDSKRLVHLEHEQVQMELTTLRAQIHPHFLFNTLNSIYALSYLDADASRKALAQTSRLLRYQFYEVKHTLTPLANELAFIKDYVSIMRLRTNNNIHIELLIPEETGDFQIAPMLLISYIENVFKHGITDDDATIFIKIAMEGDILTLKTKNKIGTFSNSLEELEIKGVGMSNAKRRLELLYASRYNIITEVDEVNRTYNLKLAIQLT
ncbi:histidine kinase [Sphingobacterium siyangense]|uniref:Histidine kinase n=2 Tax=Sphingobacterium siyangense TaxID=459529 RepID=A0A562M878_9SPHI|nr:histidine kinase [Sphingobacterium siyangense]